MWDVEAPSLNAGKGAFLTSHNQTMNRHASASAAKTAKPKKQQEDRLLKHLSMHERRRQEEIRRLIQIDPVFKTI